MKKKILIISICIVILSLCLFIYTFREKIINILIPIFISIIIAYLLHPIVKKLEKKKIPCTISITAIYVSFFIIIATILVFIIPELIINTKQLIDTLPDIITKYQKVLHTSMQSIKSSNWPADFKSAIFNELNNTISKLGIFFANTLKRLISIFLNTVLILFNVVVSMIIAYYLIKDAKFFKNAALSLVPLKWQNSIISTGREINCVVASFIQGQLLTALIIGVLETIGLIILKVKYPLFLGFIGGIANIVPYFGPIIGAVPAIAVALIDSPLKALWTIILFIIIQQIDNIFISPRIVESKLGLHPVTTILAVLIGGEFFGIIGIIVAVPITAILKIIFKRVITIIV